MKVIRRFRNGDETELAALIRRCFFEINTQDYTTEALKYWAGVYTPEHVKELAEEADMYVMEEDGVLLGTCSVLRKSGKEVGKEAFIEALYVLPDRGREGIATQLLTVCENDPACEDAERIWVDSSITARRFYEQRGYLHETGEPVCIENDRYIMYKPR